MYSGVLKDVIGGIWGLRAGGVKREFVNVGDAHLKNVRLLSNYDDQMLLSAVGREVSISVVNWWWAGNEVIAIRMPDGRMAGPSSGKLIWWFLLMSLAYGIIGVVVGLLLALISPVLFLAVLVCALGFPWVYLVRTLRARKAV